MEKFNNDVIKKDDRPNLVRDYNYGDVISNDLESIDLPEKSIIEFDKNENITFENYNELEKYLDEIFIPKYIQMKVKVDKNTNDVTYDPSIQLNHIVRLKLSELEVKKVFDYLEKLNIKVSGISPDLDLDFDIKNYNYVRTFKSSEKKEYDPTLNDEARIAKYHQTKDKKLRDEIIENNMRLASFVAYKYSMITGIDIKELESYAYEGLIIAIENFKNLGTRFSTYAYPCIRGLVLRGIEKIEGYYKSNFYYGYINCKKTVEDVNGITIEENPNLLKDIYDLMIQTNRLSGCDFNTFKNLIYIIKPILMENMDELEDSYNIEEEALNEILKEDIKEVLSTLTEREQIVIINRFGLFGNEAKSQKEVGKMLGITDSRIFQIERKALRKLRHPLRSKKIK